jgi:hypothetical protein
VNGQEKVPVGPQVGRFGGEEFVVGSRGCQVDACSPASSKVRLGDGGADSRHGAPRNIENPSAASSNGGHNLVKIMVIASPRLGHNRAHKNRITPGSLFQLEVVIRALVLRRSRDLGHLDGPE